MEQNYYTMSQAVDMLGGVKAYQISYLLMTRQIPEPARIGGRRCFTLPELARISEILKLDLARDLQARAARRGK